MNVWTIQIHDWLPPLTNRSRGRHWSKSHKATTEVAEFVRTFAAQAGVKFVSDIHRPVRSVRIQLNVKRKKPDPDAVLKNLLDGLKRAGVIVDDSQKWCRWERPRIDGPTIDDRTATTIWIEDASETAAAIHGEPPVVAFTRATIERRPWYADMKPPPVDFKLHFNHPTKEIGEQLFLSYTAVDPVHLDRLRKWCASLGVTIEDVTPAAAKSEVRPDPELFG